LDFSKAFDTVRHASVLSKLSSLPIEDQFYNWAVNYFMDHSHVTKYQGSSSSSASINASVFQGSAVGPPFFVVNGTDLKPRHAQNCIDKYADDSYLIVPACNDHSAVSELLPVELWASNNNLKLNRAKSQKMIICSSKKFRRDTVILLPEIARVNSIKI